MRCCPTATTGSTKRFSVPQTITLGLYTSPTRQRGWLRRSSRAELDSRSCGEIGSLPPSLARFEVAHCVSPRRGSHKPAQGNALGRYARRAASPERATQSATAAVCCALSGRGGPNDSADPGRCPGLICFGPFGAKNPGCIVSGGSKCATSKRARRASVRSHSLRPNPKSRLVLGSRHHAARLTCRPVDWMTPAPLCGSIGLLAGRIEDDIIHFGGAADAPGHTPCPLTNHARSLLTTAPA